MNEQWLQILSLFLANAALIVWFRAESRADWRHMDSKVESNQKETREIIESNQKETRELIHAIHLEMKSFHGRLCAIEKNRSRNR